MTNTLIKSFGNLWSNKNWFIRRYTRIVILQVLFYMLLPFIVMENMLLDETLLYILGAWIAALIQGVMLTFIATIIIEPLLWIKRQF